MFWVRSVYFNVRNILPKSGIFSPGHRVYMFGMDRRTRQVRQCNLAMWRVRITIVAVEIRQYILCVFFRYMSLSMI